MKKISTLFFSLLLANTLIYAEGDWASCAVSISQDSGSTYLFKFSNQTWTDGNWGLNTVFDNYDFGAPTSLLLNGGAGNAWTDDTPGYDKTSFVLFYRVYKSDLTPGAWSQIVLNVSTYRNGNNYIFEKTDAAVDLLALTTVNGAYTLEVTMSKDQKYNGGNWNSMIPGGQAVAYSDTQAGYKATFTKSVSTEIKSTANNVKVVGRKNIIEASFTGEASIELYSINGMLITKNVSTNKFIYAVKKGFYLVRINGQSHKVIVQ